MRIIVTGVVVAFATWLTSCSGENVASDAPARDAPAVGEPVEVALDQTETVVAELLGDLLARAKADPSSATARGNLAMAYDVNEFTDAAVASYAQAEALDEAEFAWPYFHALAVGQGGNLDAGVVILERALALDDGYVPALLHYGGWLLDLGRPEEALAVYEKARDLNAGGAAIAGIAQAYLRTSRAEEAVAMLVPLARRFEHPHVYRLLGRAFNVLGKAEDSRIALARGKSTQPLEWRDPIQTRKRDYIVGLGVRLVLAEKFIGDGAYTDAVGILEPLREQYPDDKPLLSNLAMAYARTGRIDDALAVLAHALALYPDYFAIHNVMANVYIIKEDESLARQHLETSIELNPTQSWPFEQIATMAMDAGDWDAAITAIDSALRYEMEAPERLLYQAGLIEGSRERWEEAIARFERATSYDASHTIAFIYLGRCLAEAGRFEQAEEAFAWAERLGTHPDDLESARIRAKGLQAAVAGGAAFPGHD